MPVLHKNSLRQCHLKTSIFSFSSSKTPNANIYFSCCKPPTFQAQVQKTTTAISGGRTFKNSINTVIQDTHWKEEKSPQTKPKCPHINHKALTIFV